MFLTKRYSQRHIRVDSENVQLLPHYLRLFLVLKLCQVVIISCEGKRKAWEGKHERGPAETHTPRAITDFTSSTGAQGLTLYSNSLSLTFPVGSVVKNPPANAGDTVLILGWEDPLEKGIAIQYFCVGKPIDRVAWCTTVHRVTKLTKRVRHNLATEL